MNKLGLSYIGWDTNSHLQAFDLWNNKGDLEFDFVYGCFSEQSYLLESVQLLENPEVVDIGCATGTTYRFLHNKIKGSGFSYRGFDLSNPAIEKAKSLYPGVDFARSNGERLYELLGLKADIVFSRDTILHQEDPYDFLDQLIEITERFLVVRLRTRDHGETEFDVSKSCQMHYDNFWMPYIVLNIDELISYIKNKNNVKKVTINKSYEVLGGQNYRFLPKDLYLEEAGTAETSIMIELDAGEQKGKVEIIHDNKIQGHPFLRLNRFNFKYLIYRAMSKFRNRN
jgi:SAM-dependent methyltransferase